MSNTTMTEPTTIGGYAIDDYKAVDEDGHTGTGRTAQEAQTALEYAQEKDVASAHDSTLLGWIVTPKDK